MTPTDPVRLLTAHWLPYLPLAMVDLQKISFRLLESTPASLRLPQKPWKRPRPHPTKKPEIPVIATIAFSQTTMPLPIAGSQILQRPTRVTLPPQWWTTLYTAKTKTEIPSRQLRFTYWMTMELLQQRTIVTLGILNPALRLRLILVLLKFKSISIS